MLADWRDWMPAPPPARRPAGSITVEEYAKLHPGISTHTARRRLECGVLRGELRKESSRVLIRGTSAKINWYIKVNGRAPQPLSD